MEFNKRFNTVKSGWFFVYIEGSQVIVFKKYYIMCMHISPFKVVLDHVRQNNTKTTNVTVNPVLSGHSKLDKTKVLKTNDSLMKVESIAECSLRAFCNTFDLH